MCHLRRLNYICGHADVIMRSSCRKTIPKLTRDCQISPAEKWLHLKETVKLVLQWKAQEQLQIQIPACRPSVSLDLYSNQTCGFCQFGQRMAGWEKKVEGAERELADARSVWEHDGVLETRLAKELENLLEEKGLDEWECRQRFPTMKKASIVRKEKSLGVKVGGGSPLRHELYPDDVPRESREDLPVVDAEYIPYSTFWDFFEDRYSWMGPQIDWGALSSELDAEQQHVLTDRPTPSER